MKLKSLITHALYTLYRPYIIRKEKLVATRLWHDGVRQAEQLQRELVTPRVYLLYDAKHMVWAPMTYEENRLLKPSFKVLRRMGKMHGLHNIHSVADLKRVSYYYTPSRWGAKGCDFDNRIRTEKLAKWIYYYLHSLSVPMAKIRQYEASRHPSPQNPTPSE